MMSAQISKYRISLVLTSLLTAACSTLTTPMPTENRASVEHSKVYVEKLTVVAASSRDARIGACAVPTGLKGANTGKGESKVWKDLVGRADTCVNERNWPVLENLANEMSKADLDNPWPAYFLSLAAEARGDLSRAIWMTELANKKSGDKVALFVYQRGRIWMKMGDTGKAMTDLQKSVAMEPSLLEGQLYLAEIFNRDQDFGKAEAYYRAALKVDEKSYFALTGLAEIDLTKDSGQVSGKDSGKDSIREAADFFSRATAVNQKVLYPWLRLSYIFENLQKNPDLALSTYKSMKSKLDNGLIQGKVEFDLNARIKSIEDDIRARQPAAAAQQIFLKKDAGSKQISKELTHDSVPGLKDSPKESLK